MGHYNQTRPQRRLLAWATSACVLLAMGCMGPIFRQQSPDAELVETQLSESQLIGTFAHPYGMGFMKVEGIGLVTSLNNTGGDPPPSGQRAALLAEMNRREVERPNSVLASPKTALVVIRGLIPPGIQPGDPYDLEVATMPRSETTSLRGGWLRETRLTETAVLGGQVRKGHPTGLGQGAILVDPTAKAEGDEGLATAGRILGGGIATKGRSLGLILDQEYHSFRTSQLIGQSINKRFHSFQGGQKQGVAVPKTDTFVEVALHPRYKGNVDRYMRVLRSVAVRESPSARQARLKLLADQLIDPVTTSTAALRLEAIGDESAIELLHEGLRSRDAEVRFHSAEALAYLDQTEAVATLAESARNEPAFRQAAFMALSAMDDGIAYDALRQLLEVRSAETRYGAFRSLWRMSPNDPLMTSTQITKKFSYHRLNVKGPAMVHVTRSHRPEIVLFGQSHQLVTPVILDAGPRLAVNGLKDGEIVVSRFGIGEPTQQRTVSTDLDAVIRAIVDLGGDYPDVVQMLQQAHDRDALTSRFEVNALPENGRSYNRRKTSSDQSDGDAPEDDAPEEERTGII